MDTVYCLMLRNFKAKSCVGVARRHVFAAAQSRKPARRLRSAAVSMNRAVCENVEREAAVTCLGA
jgi:hypothetical protein